MAIYHLSAQVLGRRPKVQKDGSKRPGSNAVAAAAYRSGERLKFDGRDGEGESDRPRVHDYSRRSGIAHAEIMLPEGAAEWLGDRERLWNHVEAMEVRNDAQLARELNVAIPHELTLEQRLELVRSFVAENFVNRGMVADIALHEPDPDKGMSEKNQHAHIMLTLRKATPQGLHPVKTREWNSRDQLVAWRSAWSEAANAALERAGKRDRIDHRTLVAQRKDALRRGDHIAAAALNRAPEVHQGPRGRQAVKRGFTVRSGPREVGPMWHREQGPDGRPVVVKGRRVLDTRRYDQGTRLSWFDELLVGNNEVLRRDLAKLDRQAARMQRKWLYWTRQVEFWAEGQIMGKQFRFDRFKAAQEERERKAEAQRRRAHAQKRRDQADAIGRLLADILSGGRAGRESKLRRRREVDGWLTSRAPVRDRTRSRTRQP